MNVPGNLRYTKDHEWVKLLADGTMVLVGITDFAQSELGDIVFVELKPEGTVLGEQEIFGTVEAVKTVADLFAPVAGTIVELNGSLDSAETVNQDPYGEGWMVKMQVDDTSAFDALMDAAAYTEMIGG